VARCQRSDGPAAFIASCNEIIRWEQIEQSLLGDGRNCRLKLLFDFAALAGVVQRDPTKRSRNAPVLRTPVRALHRQA
jgi:hypothetical protein